MHPVNKELINAIQIMSIAWNYPPPIPILNIIDYTKKLNKSTENKRGIYWINDKLIMDKENRTLTETYDDLKTEHPDLRKISFNRLCDLMDKEFPKKKR